MKILFGAAGQDGQLVTMTWTEKGNLYQGAAEYTFNTLGQDGIKYLIKNLKKYWVSLISVLSINKIEMLLTSSKRANFCN